MDTPDFNLLRSRPSDTRSSSCPQEEVWARVAAGLADSAEGEAAVSHAAECDYCGPLLRMACEDLDFDAAPGTLEPAAGSRPEPSLAVMPARGRVPGWAWVMAAAAVVILTIAGARFFLAAAEPERLVARAFERNRTLELRLPGVPYSERAPVEKGAGENTGRRISVAAAEAAVLQQLDQDPSNPRWIALRSRIDLLSYRYDSAIETLRPWSDRGDLPASQARDVGIAYLARGLAFNANPADLGKALEWLGTALDKAPDDHVALFDRALAAQHLSLWGRAAEDWNAFLKLDSASGWAAEARANLALIEQKKSTGALP